MPHPYTRPHGKDMMANPKTYYRPTTLDEALRLAGQPNTIALAGGALTFGALDLPCEAVIDLQAISELGQIEPGDNGIYVGGAVSLQQVIELPPIQPTLKRALMRTLPLNLRSGATLMESLIAPNPLREWLAALVALDVGVERALPDGTRVIDGFANLIESESDLRAGIISRVFFPFLDTGEALGSAFVARTPADEPIVNAAAFVELSADNKVETPFIAIGGASEQPVVNLYLHTLEGNPLDKANIASAVKLVAPSVNPIGDYKGSADYRREMARVCVQRALLDCLDQLSTQL